MADPKKPGWKTSEGLFTLAAGVLSALYIAGVFDGGGAAGKVAAFVAMALTAAGYSVSRGQVKAANAAASAPTPPSP